MNNREMNGIKMDKIKMDKFQKDLKDLINKYSIENICDMPDFLLAEMVVNLIQTIGHSTKKTIYWHGYNSSCPPKTTDE